MILLLVSTDDILDSINEIAEDKGNKNEHCTLKEEKEIEAIKKQEKEKKADISLVAYCKKLKDSKKEAALIIDERKISPNNERAKMLYKILQKNIYYL